MEYDRQTIQILKKTLKPDSNCLDIGCHKGDILKLMLKYAPNGTHFGFEPIPLLAADLKTGFEGKAKIYEVGLAGTKGTSTFNYVVSRPEYSGIKKRDYDRAHEKDTQITIQTDTMDNLVPAGMKIDLIKIDVEGGEYGVLTGGRETIKRNRPFIVFEHGKGAAEHYETTPEMVFEFINGEFDLKVNTMEGFLRNQPSLDERAFTDQFESGENYYFIAHP